MLQGSPAQVAGALRHEHLRGRRGVACLQMLDRHAEALQQAEPTLAVLGTGSGHQAALGCGVGVAAEPDPLSVRQQPLVVEPRAER
eukprot:12402083-Alexandrium_andersonii.AAC.1